MSKGKTPEYMLNALRLATTPQDANKWTKAILAALARLRQQRDGLRDVLTAFLGYDASATCEAETTATPNSEEVA